MVKKNTPIPAIPQELIDLEIDDKGPNRCFVGRTRELAQLDRMLTKLRRTSAQPERRNTNVGLLLTAVPGAGKTTLQRQAAVRWRRRGLGIIHLRAFQFEDRQTLREAIADQQLVQQAEQSALQQAKQVLKKQGPSMLAKPLDKAVAIGAKAINAQLEEFVEKRMQLARSLVQRLRQSRGTDNTLHLLSVCDELFPKGWIVMVDEVQQLQDYVEGNATREFIQTLCDPQARRDHGIKLGCIWMTGLGNSHAVLRRLDISRYQHDRLLPIDVHSARKLIEQSISRGGGKVEAPRLVDAWAMPLVERYHVWTHHLVGAAQAAGWVAKHHPDHPNALDWIHVKAQDHCEGLCSEKLRDCRTVVQEEVVGLTVRVIEELGSLARKSVLQRAIVQYGESGEGVAVDLKGADTLIEQMMHEGVIEDTPRDGIIVPIPSMLTYIKDEISETPAMRQALDQIRTE